jgi:hypothetical protein
LRPKADEIVAVNKELRETVTGGGSFSYITVIGNSSNDLLRLVLVSKGKFPLYELTAVRSDLDEQFSNRFEAFYKQPRFFLSVSWRRTSHSYRKNLQ